MLAPVTQSEWAKPTANRMLPAASDAAPAMNRRIQVSAAGEKIWPMRVARHAPRGKPRLSTGFDDAGSALPGTNSHRRARVELIPVGRR